MYELCKCEEEGRCSDHKDCAACKKSLRDVRITDILTLAVRDNDLRTEFRKINVKDRTETRFHQEGTNWAMDNAIKDKYNVTETVTIESIHAVSFHKKSNNSNKNDGKQRKEKFIKSCKYCGKDHNKGQSPAKHVKCHKCSKIGHFANVCRSSDNNLHQDQQVQKLQRKQTTTIKHQPGTKPSLPRSAPIHFMSAEGFIGVADSGTTDANFHSVSWIDTIDVTYDPATQQVTCGSIVTAIHNIQ